MAESLPPRVLWPVGETEQGTGPDSPGLSECGEERPCGGSVGEGFLGRGCLLPTVKWEESRYSDSGRGERWRWSRVPFKIGKKRCVAKKKLHVGPRGVSVGWSKDGEKWGGAWRDCHFPGGEK